MQKYEFSISSDFPDHRVAPDRLTQEVATSAITVALTRIDTSGDACDLWFKTTLSEGEVGVLAALVAAHSGVPLAALVEPQDVDGRKYTAPNLFPLGVLTNFCGASDDVAAGTIGTELLTFEADAQGDDVQEFQFVQWSYLAGGHLGHIGFALGDHVSLTVYAPATAGVENLGAGDYNKVAVGGGAHVFVPATPGTGNWDLDLTAKENANVAFTKVRPVPAPGGHGYFDWDPVTEAVTLNAAGTGGYHLFDADIALNEFVTKLPLLGTDHYPLIVPAVKPIRVLAHWIFKVTLHNTSAKLIQLAATLYRARANALN
jgi:hypothetical protein